MDVEPGAPAGDPVTADWPDLSVVTWRQRAERPPWIEADLGGMVLLTVREEGPGAFLASARPAIAPVGAGPTELARPSAALESAKPVAILLGWVLVAQLVLALRLRRPCTADSIRSSLQDPKGVTWKLTSARPIAWQATLGWVELMVYERGDGSLAVEAESWSRRLHAPFSGNRPVDECKELACDLALALIVDTLDHHLGAGSTEVLLGPQVRARRQALLGAEAKA